MILTFKTDNERLILEGYLVLRWQPELQAVIRRKLRMLDAAEELKDLDLPGNGLERLRPNHQNRYSIRVNDQWHIRFRWTGTDAEDVETYHR